MVVLAHEMLTNCQDDHRLPVHKPASVAAWIGRTLRVWQSRIRERHVFDYADDHELSELGLSRWDVEREIAKPFWRD
jgi:uncharacterized protein YjiS (DUF1127 family)